MVGYGIDGSYANGTLVLSGQSSIGDYRWALSNVTFSTIAPRLAGTAIQIEVVANDGIAQSAPVTSVVTIYVPGSTTVVANQTFYGDSKFDGGSTDFGPGDDAAIATDKQALTVGQASYANLTDYNKGINGIMVNLTGTHGAISAADFSFSVGTSSDATTWTTAPAPNAIVVRQGAGIGGSDRIEITWDDYSITNEWLQVVVKADGDTDLAQPDVFYFGNLVGDTGAGDTSHAAFTNATDNLAIRTASGANQPVTNSLDINRDGFVNATDQLLTRENIGLLQMIDVPDLSSQVTLWRTGAIFQSFTPTSDTDVAHGLALRTALAQAESGDDIVLGEGTFDMGGAEHIEIPDGVTLSGAGETSTWITSSCSQAVNGNATFTLNNDSTIEDCWLQGTLRNSNYQVLVGMQRTPTENVNAYLRDVQITGDSDGIFLWTGQLYQYTLYAYDCDIRTDYDAVALIGSDNNTQSVNMWNCSITVQQPDPIGAHLELRESGKRHREPIRLRTECHGRRQFNTNDRRVDLGTRPVGHRQLLIQRLGPGRRRGRSADPGRHHLHRHRRSRFRSRRHVHLIVRHRDLRSRGRKRGGRSIGLLQ